MEAMSEISLPGMGGTTLSFTFSGSANAGLARAIADALYAASVSGTLSITSYTAGTSLPVVPSGNTQELVLAPSVTGSVTVPAPAPGVSQVLVISNTQPVTIHGSPGLQIIGGGPDDVYILDPASIILADQGGNTALADLVSVTAADSNYTVAMRAGNETVYSSGSGTISGGSVKNLINVQGASGSNLIISDGSAGDTVFTGSGSTTIDATANAHGGLYIDGAGSFTDIDAGLNDTIEALDAASANITTGGSNAMVIGGTGTLSVQDSGGADTIAARAGNLSATTGGTNAFVFGSSSTLSIDAGGGTGDTVAFGAGGGAFMSTASSSDALLFAGVGSVSVNGSNTTNDTIVGDSGPLRVNAGSANGLLVFGPLSGTGMDFVGGSGSATVAGQAGNDTIFSGSGPLEIVAGPNETLLASGGVSGTTMFGGANSDITYGTSSGSLLFVAGLGNETLNASAATSNVTMWAGLDSTAGNSLVGGSGTNMMVAGTGADTMVGNVSSQDMFAFFSVNGGAAAKDYISNFGTLDSVLLYGYGTAAAAAAISGAASSGGNTTITLADSTKITFIGVSSASALSGHIFSS
jgi:hypothetical protein